MSGRKILLVDDSALIRAVVLHTLGQSGVAVTSIEDPRELAAALARERPDLVLLDATFPKTDHAALAALVHPHASVCPIVLFSDQPPDVIRALVPKLGAIGAVPKSASAELWTKLQTFLPAR